MLQGWREGRHLIVTRLFVLLLLACCIVKSNFAQSAIRVYLIALLHLISTHLILPPLLKLHVGGFLSHHFVCVLGAAQLGLVVVDIHSNKVFAFLEFLGCLLILSL